MIKGVKENPPLKISKSQKRERWRPRQSKAKNLLDRFIEYKEKILRFATNLRVPFDNNPAERDLRARLKIEFDSIIGI